MELKRIAIFGSTGSIGKQTLEVIEHNSHIFKVEILTANDNAIELIAQSMKFKPNIVVIANPQKYVEVKEALKNEPCKVFSGEKSLEEVATLDCYDIMVAGLVGIAGLKPTIEAIKNKKNIALANKETLVVAGELIMHLAKLHKVHILPVDSEHSAIFQCLVGEYANTIEKIILTASGGPFLGKNKEFLKDVKASQALKNPNWTMGKKVSIDSATLMNKGLEMIEAKWLFDLNPQQIEVIIHPQSIIHSMVEFEDGSIKAQLSLPNMRLPIQYALSFPIRISNQFPKLQFATLKELQFQEADTTNFRNLELAKIALHKGGNYPCILNAANEIAVEAFLQEKIGFFEMTEIIETTMAKFDFKTSLNLEMYVELDQNARTFAKSLITKYKNNDAIIR